MAYQDYQDRCRTSKRGFSPTRGTECACAQYCAEVEVNEWLLSAIEALDYTLLLFFYSYGP